MYCSLGDDVGVQAVAEVDGVDVVAISGKRMSAAGMAEKNWPSWEGQSWKQRDTRWGRIPFQIAVHDGEEDLKKQVHGVYQHRKEE